jgi:glutamate-ammonia-ligase adenylyltransferase
MIHQAASKVSLSELQTETRRVRERLEQEQSKPSRRGRLDIKFGPGGMLDVYFATRYLQLRHDVRDEGVDRFTLTTLIQLKERNYLSDPDFEALHKGYRLLRRVDHEQRLLFGRLAKMPPLDHPALGDIARKLGYESATELVTRVRDRMAAIREAYDRILEGNANC